MAGCAKNPLVEVKVIRIHHTSGGWNDSVGDWSLVERTDTHERLFLSTVYGEPGEVFKVEQP